MPRDYTVLHELANVGAGHAATALSQLFSTRVGMTPPVVRELDTAAAVEFLAPSSDEVSAAMLYVEGELSGLLVLLTRDTEAMIAGLAVDPGIEADVISELGNIVAAKLTDAIGTMTNIIGHPTLPAAGVTAHTCIVEMILALTARVEPFVMVISDISVGDSLVASLMFYPDAASIEQIEALA